LDIYPEWSEAGQGVLEIFLDPEKYAGKKELIDKFLEWLSGEINNFIQN